MEGEWVLNFKTVGKRVTLDLTIDIEGSNTIIRCKEGAFVVNKKDNLIGWQMKVPVMEGMAPADFRGKMKDQDSLHGILVIHDEPYHGGAVKWSASRKRLTH